jgi:hypothetical protein
MRAESDRLYLRDLIWGGLWGALALFLPLLFHPFGLGVHLMPMFLPLLIAAGTLRLSTALILAVVIPLLSGAATGMPPLYPPVAFLMVLEGAAMVLWTGVVYRRRGWNLYLCLVAAFVIQRLVRVGFIFLARELVEIPAGWLLVPALLWGLPGAALQTAVIPPVVGKIEERFGGGEHDLETGGAIG